MDEDDETTTATNGVTPARINWADLAYSGTSFLIGLAEATADSLGYLRAALAQHSAHIGEQQEFKRTAGRELEALPTQQYPPTP